MCCTCRVPERPTWGLFGTDSTGTLPGVSQTAILQHFPLASGGRGQVWRHQPGYWRPCHFHPEVELNFVSRGAARMAVGGDTVELGEGSAVWFISGQSHELLEASSDLELWVIGATPDFSAAIGGLPSSAPASRCSCASLNRSVTAELYERCMAIARDGCRSSEDAVAAILERARMGAATARPASFDPLTARAVGHLWLEPGLSRSALARRLRVSEAELSRRVHAQLGVPFQEYRHRIRVMQFVDRMRRREQDFLRAALEAGFGSYSQCFRAFVRVIGQSPRSYCQTGRGILESAVADASAERAQDLQ